MSLLFEIIRNTVKVGHNEHRGPVYLCAKYALGTKKMKIAVINVLFVVSFDWISGKKNY